MFRYGLFVLKSWYNYVKLTRKRLSYNQNVLVPQQSLLDRKSNVHLPLKQGPIKVNSFKLLHNHIYIIINFSARKEGTLIVFEDGYFLDGIRK